MANNRGRIMKPPKPIIQFAVVNILQSSLLKFFTLNYIFSLFLIKSIYWLN